MILKYFYDKALAQASYLIGCPATGEALIIDPSRDIMPYLMVAEEEGLNITQVTETHIHADFVSGARELAQETGATIYLSDTGTEDWKYGYADEKVIWLTDNHQWTLGNVGLTAWATPGHTPEHICILVHDNDVDKTVGIFSGDCLFIGSVGRPDLLEKSAGVSDSTREMAQQQFTSIQRIKTLPDYVQVWPGHGAGSACGKSLSAMPSSTIGFERIANRGMQIDDEDQFIEWLLDSQPEPPTYFAQMKHVNKVGPALLDSLTPYGVLHVHKLHKVLDDGGMVIDTRHGDAFAHGHIPGTIHIPSTSQKFNTYVGWFVDYDAPLYLIADPQAMEARLIYELRAIGVDNVHGYWTTAAVEEAIANGEIETTPEITPEALAAHMDDYYIVDVRGAGEYAEHNIQEAHHIMLGYLQDNLQSLPKDQPIVVHCATGIRSMIGVSLLQKHGFTQVYNLKGGIVAWDEFRTANAVG